MTDILKAVATDRDARHRILARTPLGRIGEPDEIASIAVFLASSVVFTRKLLVDRSPLLFARDMF